MTDWIDNVDDYLRLRRQVLGVDELARDGRAVVLGTPVLAGTPAAPVRHPSGCRQHPGDHCDKRDRLVQSPTRRC